MTQIDQIIADALAGSPETHVAILAREVVRLREERAVVSPKCEPIPTSGQREKVVWNDGFAHGWRFGFDGAHDLLEALEGLKMLLLEWHKELPDHVGDKEGAYLDKADAAIAKAKNEAPFALAEVAVVDAARLAALESIAAKIEALALGPDGRAWTPLHYREFARGELRAALRANQGGAAT